jgi:hemolysin activation/secretion protein
LPVREKQSIPDLKQPEPKHSVNSTQNFKFPDPFAIAPVAIACALCLATGTAHAQIAPDAGQTLQQLKQPIEPPQPSAPLLLERPPTALPPPGGAQVKLSGLRFNGNTVFDAATLLAAAQPDGGSLIGQSLDMAGLGAAAARVSEFYRAAGYPFARALIVPQDLSGGVLQISILEGRFGKVTALAEDSLAQLEWTPAQLAQAQGFLKGLQPGQVIQSPSLARSILILDDQPGVRAAATIKPGETVGTGDLEVVLVRTPPVTGDVGLDNQGSRYSGYYRALASLNFNSPFMLGDQVSLRSLYSDENLWLGSLGYSLPVGGGGLRANAGYSVTGYTLGKEFASTQSNGIAKVTSVGVSYPLLRSQAKNLHVSASFQDKQLNDRKDAALINESKSSTSLPVSLQFDQRDGVGLGGITYGAVGWTPGNLQLDNNLISADSANTRGQFDKFTLDVSRLQLLPGRISLFGHLSSQWASKNLDSSEGFILGGGNGVRAYPSGEGSGDEGWLTQLELRMNLGQWTPIVFYDAGGVKTNASPAPNATNNSRNLSGGGLGVRFNRAGLSAELVLAWRDQGGAPTSDTSSDPSPRVWFTTSYRF